MKHPSDFAICISSYLTKHLAGTRNLSSNTIKSYRDTFCLLLLFMKEMNKKIDRICLVDIDADLVIRFLDWLEVNRGNSASTRNVRLAAIHAFFRYVQFQNPEMLLHCQRILAIPMKETEKRFVEYLPEQALRELLSLPDQTKKYGIRDTALLCLLYDSGARVQELIDLSLLDIRLETPATIRLYGKGRKVRVVPLMSQTATILQKYLNPQIAGNPLSRFMQKQQIKRQYAKSARKGGAKTAQKAAENTRKAAKKTAEETKKAIAFVGRHPAGVCIAVAALLLFIMVSAGLSSCGSMFSGLMNGILGTSYTSEDSDLVATENNYAAKENELQQQIDNIESTHPGYDEYRYDLDSIGHNPHELASYLTALLQTYTPQSAQAELNRVFAMQYTLTLTEETEIRYRTETSTDPETGETTTEEVPYEYHILNVKLTNKPISEIAEELLTPQQLEMYRVYLETSGNKPLIFGGGSPDMGASEDLSGVQLVNGTRPGNTAVVDLAKRQVGNVGGRPFWSWYGFNSRVEWCACFVSWCYNQAGKSEPRFAGCQSQGVPWFQSRGQWGARGYENIAPGDAIFFDWDGDGSADHVGLVIGTDGERVYTVEGNSGDACKIKSYPVNYSCIKGYGLMNWN